MAHPLIFQRQRLEANEVMGFVHNVTRVRGWGTQHRGRPGYLLFRGAQTRTFDISQLHPQGLAPNGFRCFFGYVGLSSIPVINTIKECERKILQSMKLALLEQALLRDISKS